VFLYRYSDDGGVDDEDDDDSDTYPLPIPSVSVVAVVSVVRPPTVVIWVSNHSNMGCYYRYCYYGSCHRYS
jgi:hypothetical protein